MPNVTISVSDELKADMDRIAEVNWSEVCRNAISRYITERKNPSPNIELDLRSSRLTADTFETGYPTLSIDLRIYNKMDSAITVDRILSNEGKFFLGLPCEGGMAWNLGRKLTSERTLSKRFNIDYKKVVKIEHCNTAEEVLKCAENYFSIQKKKFFPFNFIQYIFCNLTVAGQYTKKITTV